MPSSRGHAKALETLGRDTDPRSTRLLLSNDPLAQTFGGTRALHWREGIDLLESEI